MVVERFQKPIHKPNQGMLPGPLPLTHPQPTPGPMPGDLPGNLDRPGVLLADVEALLQAIDKRVDHCISECLTVCGNNLLQCQSCVEGCLERALVAAENALGKHDAKLHAVLMGLLSEAYGHALNAGMNVPTLEEVNHELQFGPFSAWQGADDAPASPVPASPVRPVLPGNLPGDSVPAVPAPAFGHPLPLPPAPVGTVVPDGVAPHTIPNGPAGMPAPTSCLPSVSGIANATQTAHGDGYYTATQYLCRDGSVAMAVVGQCFWLSDGQNVSDVQAPLAGAVWVIWAGPMPVPPPSCQVPGGGGATIPVLPPGAPPPAPDSHPDFFPLTDALIPAALDDAPEVDIVPGGGGEPEAPPEPVLPEPWDFGIWPDWGSPNVCGKLADYVTYLEGTNPKTISYWFGLRTEGGDPNEPEWVQMYVKIACALPRAALWTISQTARYFGQGLVAVADNTSTTILGSAVSPLSKLGDLGRSIIRVADVLDAADGPALAETITDVADALRFVLDALGELIIAGAKRDNCKISVLLIPLTVQLLLGAAEKYLSSDFSDIKTGIKYFADYTCPNELPGVGEATSAYLGGEIDHEIWRCWIRANNALEYPAERVLQAGRSKLDWRTALRLYRLGKITSDRLLSVIRWSGFIQEEDWADALASYDQVPGVGDIVSFMTRDAFDQESVEWGGLDDEFEDKFAGQLRVWADAQGVGEDYMRAVWRSHWQLPERYTLQEAMHRLRPGRADKDVEVTPDDVKRVLAQNDMVPAWQKRVLALMDKPLNWEDGVKGFTIGALTLQELEDTIRDHGYGDREVELLLRVVKRNVALHWSDHFVLHAFREGAIGAQQAAGLLQQFGCPPEVMGEALGITSLKTALDAKTICVRALHRRMLVGDFTADQATAALIGSGVEAGQAVTIVSGWNCEIATRGHVVPARVLAGWYARGLIGDAELIRRLVNVGWTRRDALLFRAEQKAKQADKAKAAAKRQAGEAKKRAADRIKIVDVEVKRMDGVVTKAEKAEAKATADEAKGKAKKSADLRKRLDAAQDKLDRVALSEINLRDKVDIKQDVDESPADLDEADLGDE